MTNMHDIHPLQTVTELRLLAAAIELQHLTSMAANLVMIPGGERMIAIGTPADVARLLEVPAAGSASPAAAGLTDEMQRLRKVSADAILALNDAKFPATARHLGESINAVEREVLAHAGVGAQPASAELSDAAIDEVWNAMPGGADGWLKQFGYRQFARSVARHVLVRVAASMAGTIRPTDDELWEQTIGERDHYHDMADKLAEAIAKHFGAEIGEHSNMNCPWAEALDVIEGGMTAEAVKDGQWLCFDDVQRALARAGQQVGQQAGDAAVPAAGDVVDGTTLRTWSNYVVQLEAEVGALRAQLASARQDAEPKWQRITAPGQVKVGDKLRFTIGDVQYNECVKQILNPGQPDEELIYNKRRNFYVITSNAITNFGSSKNVEFLAARTQLTNTATGN